MAKTSNNRILNQRGKPIGSAKSSKAYDFLVKAQEEQRAFTLAELAAAAGWKGATTGQYAGGRLSQFLHKSDKGYRVNGIAEHTREEFFKLVSQDVFTARDPFRPPISPKAEELISKARETALTAVQHYNNPTIIFRSGTYIILMVVAFTALFHAIFERDGIEYKETSRDGTVKKVGVHDALWNVLKCADEYCTRYSIPAQKDFPKCLVHNLQFLSKLRDVFEHRDMPQLDATIGPECQSALMNLETIIVHEFTPYYSIGTSLALPLFTSTELPPQAIAAIRRFQSAEYEALKAQINDFRTGLADEIITNPAYAFRVWLVPKPASDAKRSDAVFEVVKIDQNDPKQAVALSKAIALLKPVVTRTTNTDKIMPKEVARRVVEATGKKFIASMHHARAWKQYNIRPGRNAANPMDTNVKYCYYDEAHGDYVYTEEWVKFLIEEMQDQAKYEALSKYKI